jgi:ubiquinone/menaquinone biosynthesis C-methylase UbiE
MDEQSLEDLQSSYDRVAPEYVRRISDELQHKPLDRELLDRFADSVRERGVACDMGCGPGHVARYLHERGVQVIGVDLSPVMLEQARQLNPGITFIHGNMLALDVPDRSWAGIAAFYSIIHLPRDEVVNALREWKRVLQPRAPVLLAFHIGSEIRHMEEWWGQPVKVDFLFFTTDEMKTYLHEADFDVEWAVERAPYEGFEVATQRAYIFARSPGEIT